MIAGFLVVGALLWFLRGALEPTEPRPAPATPQAVAAATSPAPAMRAPVAQPRIAAVSPAAKPDLGGHDTLDPCTAVAQPFVPTGFETLTVRDITVAWSPDKIVNPGPGDIALSPTAIAHLVDGLLEEAAALTGTSRRDQLTVAIYPTSNDFTAQTHAPAWAEGAYDGAVHVAVKPNAELGVSIATLRHEVMHAQLHAGVGCMPAWFNEGAATYFAGSPPAREWIKMLRSPEAYELRSLQGATFAAMTADRATRAYAVSLAMIMFLVEQTGDDGLKTAVRALQAAERESSRAGLDLWDRMFPRVDHVTVLNALARKVFGVALGGELDAMLRAAVCCYGLHAVREFGCRSAPLNPGRSVWVDPSGSRLAVCRAAW